MIWWTLRKLRSKKVDSRIQAIRELGNSTDGRAFEALHTAVIGDPSGAVKIEALRMVARFGHVSTVDTLIESLRDPDTTVRTVAVRLLVDRPNKTEPDLRKLSAVDDPEVSQHAHDQMKSITERHEREMIERREREADSKLGISPKARSLIKELQSNITTSFSLAARSLEELGWKIIISNDTVFLESKGRTVPAEITYDALVDKLERIVGCYLLPSAPTYKEDLEELRWSLRAVGRLRCARLTSKLLRSVGDSTHQPAWPLAWAALESIGSGAVDELGRLAAGSAEAVVALNRIGTNEALEYLQLIAVDPKLPAKIKETASELLALRAKPPSESASRAAVQGSRGPITSTRQCSFGLTKTCGSTTEPLRIRLEVIGGQLVEDLVCARHAANCLDGQDKDAALPNVLPELVREQQVQADPGPGSAVFREALGHWNNRRLDEAVKKYQEALKQGLAPPYEAAARSNLGQGLLARGDVLSAISQFTRCLHTSPQIHETAYDAAIRIAIICEERGISHGARIARAMANVAGRGMNSSLSVEAADRIRTIVRENRHKLQ